MMCYMQILGSSASYSLIIQVTATDGQRVITLRSPLQVNNIPFLKKELPVTTIIDCCLILIDYVLF